MNHTKTKGAGKLANNFTWYVKGENIVFKSDENASKGSFTEIQIITILAWLHGKFEHKYFPLANHVRKVRHEKEKMGFGTAVHKCSTANPAHASFLGSILEQIGIFEFQKSGRSITWRISNTVELKDIQNIIAIAKKYKQPKATKK